jgi:hypothetical protein
VASLLTKRAAIARASLGASGLYRLPMRARRVAAVAGGAAAARRVPSTRVYAAFSPLFFRIAYCVFQ